MSPCQIRDMDVVSDTRTILCGVVIPEDVEPGQLSHRHLGDVGHQVIGYPAGIFADSAARVCAHRIKIARSEEHTSELQSRGHLVCRLLLEKKQAMLLTE